MLKNITLEYSHTTLFQNFTTQVHYGSKIAIIGRNGSGKSSLLKMISGLIKPSDGEISVPDCVRSGYVSQITNTNTNSNLSGGEKFNYSLSQELSKDPNLLLLDEPTNHLDIRNKKSLIRMLSSFHGTLIMVTHDLQLLRQSIDYIWHIDNHFVHCFSGRYDDYMRELMLKKTRLELAYRSIKREEKESHKQLMREQQRASKSKSKGIKNIEQRKYGNVTSKTKADRASETSGKKLTIINDKKLQLQEYLSELPAYEVITPKFSFYLGRVDLKNLITISDASVSYPNLKTPILSNIYFSISNSEKVAILGDNRSGKTTFIKAIMCDNKIIREGIWNTLDINDIGYLDQHYSTLDESKTVLQTIQEIMNKSSVSEIRLLLNNFLFKKNEEVNKEVRVLSGGERVRLSLAQIAAKTPKILILDEITNNLDLETREHVVQVLREYPGALLVISHDPDFLDEINIERSYIVKDGMISCNL